jgi:hypothetical protein
MSKIRLTKMAVAGVLVVATATPIAAQTVFANGNRHMSVFTSTSSAVGAPPDTSRCGTPIDPTKFPCVVTLNGTDTKFSGALEGAARGAEASILGARLVPVAPVTFSRPFVSWEKVNGTAAGCGTGIFLLEISGNLNTPTGEWEVVKGSGIGALATLRGSGTYAAEVANGQITVTYTGRLRCGDNKYDRGNHDD